ncbi:MFS general substrate transporter [Ceratobasidium sp. AG-I]|nr:MFS general substrate transporter [Ceratobasidium sp. AG-I]
MVELTDETNQAQCFAFFPLIWSTGSTLGPFLGGTLSHPATLFPRVFDTPFWRTYPYFLPCLVIALFTAGIFVLSAFFLKETLHAHVERKPDAEVTGNMSEYGAVTDSTRPAPTRAPTIRSVLTTRACIAIVNYAFLAFSDITYLGLLPIVFAVPVAKGGLGLAPRAIGLILGLQGIVTGIVQVFFFAPIHKRLGSKYLHLVGLTAYLFLALSLPAMHLLASHGMVRSMWVLIAIHILLSCPAFMAFSCIAIFVANAAPSKSSLGTLNGISQTTISIIRAVGPATATSLFAVSVEKDLLGGWFVYAVLTGVNVLGLIASRWLTEEKMAY